jgi:protein-tyrosine phosphatase
MDFINDRIAIGNKRDAYHLPNLMEAQITGMLNCAIHLDVNLIPAHMDHFPVEYHKVAMNDNENNRPETLEAAVLCLEQLLERHDKVLVHCRAGASRSVTVVCLYLVKHEGLTFDEALQKVKQERNRANPNPGIRQLADEVIRKWASSSDSSKLL